MKFSSSVALVVAVAAPFVSAQSLADLPACAQQAGLAAIQSSGCAVTDVACICSKMAVLDALRASITQACSAEDQTSALAFANTLCGAAGQPSAEPPAAATPAPDPNMPTDMPMSTAMAPSPGESMMASMSSDTVAYTSHSGTGTPTMDAGTMSSNMTMATPSSSAHMNMSGSATSMDESMSMSRTAGPAEYTGGAPSGAASLLQHQREWLLSALGFVGVAVAAF